MATTATQLWPSSPARLDRIQAIYEQGDTARADALARITEGFHGFTKGACPRMVGARIGERHLTSRSYRILDGTSPAWEREVEG